MSETPKCPGCGADMELMHLCKATFCYACTKCGWDSPIGIDSESAFRMAMRRAEPKNRVLTFDEVATYADLPEMTLMWVEVKFAKESDIFQEIPIGFNGELVQFLYPNGARLYTDKHNFPPEDYGSRWRCWLRKPTAEETKKTPWEEESHE
ncbi:MAG: hypothetical protein KH382_09025 [Clostridiales bacterium]|nr:hypothetical protein [Clostridiales bacterium]